MLKKPKRGRPFIEKNAIRVPYSASISQVTEAVLNNYTQDLKTIAPGANSGRMLDLAARHLIKSKFNPTQL